MAVQNKMADRVFETPGLFHRAEMLGFALLSRPRRRCQHSLILALIYYRCFKCGIGFIWLRIESSALVFV